jgi:hypothetical protein
MAKEMQGIKYLAADSGRNIVAFFVREVVAVKLDSGAGNEDFSSCKALVLTRGDGSSSSFWTAVSTSYFTGVEIASTRKSASAMMLSWPDKWRMSSVNWDVKCRWLSCLGEHLSLFW